MDNEKASVAGGQGAGQTGPLDIRVFNAFRTRGHFQPLEILLKLLSQSGNWGLFWVGVAAAAWAAGADMGRGMFILTIMFVYPTLVVNYIVKVSVGRERPAAADPRLKPLVGVPSSKSFPSSHAAMSFAAATAMTYYYPALAPVFYLLALVMSWSRVYLGVHYPSDILAGMAVGLAFSLFWWQALIRWVLA